MKDAVHIGRVGALAVALGIGLAVGGPAGLAWASPESSSSAEGGNAESTGSVGSDSGTGNGPVDSPSSRVGDRDGAPEAQKPSSHRRSEDARNVSRSDSELTSWRDRIRDRRTRPQRESVLTPVTMPSPSTPDRREPVAPVGAVPVLAVASTPRREGLTATAAPPTYSTSSTPVGRDPSGVAVSTDGSRAYVANSADRSVSVVNTATGAVTGSISVGGTPSAVAVDPRPGSSRAYVALKSSGRLSVVDTSNNTVTTTVPVGLSPTAVAVSMSGSRVYVANTVGGTVSVIDPTVNKRVATVSVGLSPVALAVSSDGSRVYAALRGSDQIAVMDAARNTVITRVRVGDAPQDIAITPDGTRLYAVNGAGSVSMIETSSNRVVAQAITVGPSPTAAAVSRDGSRVYVVNGNDTVSVIDTSSATVVQTFSIDTTPEVGGHDIAVSADGSRLYVTDQRDAMLRVVTVVPGNNLPALTAGPSVGEPDLGTGAVSGSFTVRDPDGDPLTYSLTTPPGRGGIELTAVTGNLGTTYTYVYTPTPAARQQAAQPFGVAWDNFTVTVRDPVGAPVEVAVVVPIEPLHATSSVTPIRAGDGPFQSVVSGDNLYVVNAGGSVSVIRRATNAVVDTIEVSPDGLAATEDGRRVFLSYGGGSAGSIAVLDTRTKSIVATIAVPDGTPGGYNSGYTLVTSPDSKRLYILNKSDSLVSVVDTATNQIISTTNLGYWYGEAAISRDGSRLYRTDAFGDLQVIDVTGTPKIVGTVNVMPISSSFEARAIAVSPDGKRALVLSVETMLGVNGAISVIDIDPQSTTYHTELRSGYVGWQDNIAVDFTTGRIFVSNVYLSDGEVFDTATLTRLGTFAPVGQLTVDPDGTLYVADPNTDTVYAMEFDDLSA